MTLSALYWVSGFGVSLAASIALFRVLSRLQVLDHPNTRSSHHLPTPKGGGIGFVVAMSAVLITYAILDTPSLPGQILALGVLTIIMSFVGFLDDLKDLSVGKRFSVQIVLSLAVVVIALGSPGLATLSYPVWLFYFVAGLLFQLWCTNLYNFMDGIDGLAAVQGILSGMLVFTLNLYGYYPGILADSGLLIAVCCLAFLLLNFPPARIFMGDAGSAALGFLIAGIALIEFGVDDAGFWIWIISLAGFIADATTTLTIRLLRGEKIYQAHRSHLYQLVTIHTQGKLVHLGATTDKARTQAHRIYLLTFTLIFILWQVPCSILVATGYLPGLLGAVICLVPLTLGAAFLGAGRDRLALSE